MNRVTLAIACSALFGAAVTFVVLALTVGLLGREPSMCPKSVICPPGHTMMFDPDTGGIACEQRN